MSPRAATPFAALLPWLEAVFTRLLALDPETAERLGGIAGKAIAVELLGLGQTLYLLPQADRILLRADYDGEVQVRVRGTPISLLGMARSAEEAAPLGDVEIIGDLHLSRRLQSILSSFDIDWEEWLSQYLGDVLAHQLGNAGRSFAGWARDTQRTLEMDVSEYLRYEAQVLAERRDVAQFMGAVDTLREDVDRMEARIRRLRAALAAE
ncbi:MAG: ubiquinone biosynthesis accessory factor UbiJ [Gammaproteobacteria bacterium]